MDLKTFGKQVGKAFSQVINPSTYRGGASSLTPQQLNEVVNLGGDGAGAFFRYNNLNSCIEAVNSCPPLAMAVKKKTRAAINGNLQVLLKDKTESKSKEAKNLLKLLKDPNPFQTQAAFITQLYAYTSLVGTAIIFPMTATGFGNKIKNAQQLWCIPPSEFEIIYDTNSLNFGNGGIKCVKIGCKDFLPEELIIINSLDVNTGEMVQPGQPVQAFQHNINNVIGALQTESNLIKHRGPNGVFTKKLSNEYGAALPIAPEEIERVQANFKSNYGMMDTQSHVIITSAQLDYTKIGFNYKELGLDEGLKRNSDVIFESQGVSSKLFSAETKYDDLQHALQMLYNETVIPDMQNISEQITSYFLTEGEILVFDFAHVAILQSDLKKLADVRKINAEANKTLYMLDVITLGRYRELMGEVDGLNDKTYFSSLKIKENATNNGGVTA